MNALRNTLVACFFLWIGVIAFRTAYLTGYDRGYAKGHEETAIDGYERDADIYADSAATAARAQAAREASE